MSVDPVFEIECEFLNSLDYAEKSDIYLATSLLLKMYDFAETQSNIHYVSAVKHVK